MCDLKFEQLSRIRINGYKSIKECDINLKKINVLIGSNGSGKSNFISVFAMLQNILVQNLSVYVGQRGVNSLLFKGRKTTEETAIEVYFGNNSYGFVLVPTEDNRLIFKDEYFGYNHYNTQRNVSHGHSESLWKKGSGNNTDKYIQPILEKQNWKVYHFHDTSINAKVKQEHNISNNKFLLFDAANLAAFLYRLREYHESNYREIISTIKLIAPYFEDFELEPNEGNREKIVLRWKQVECDDTFNASQLSDGTLRFICIATLLLQPQLLQPATIIIDEPELGLHPYAITIFAEIVKQISANKQIIISTQSVDLLNEFDADDVIVVDRDNDGSVFNRLNEESLNEWIKADYTLGELWNKNILGGRLSK